MPSEGEAVAARSSGQLYRQGVLVSVLNPKAVLFFMAFLPQFVRPGGADPRLQVLALGGTFLALALCTDTLWAVTAGRAGGWLRDPRRQGVRRWVSAAVYFALAAGAAWPRG
jgi:threonine/homoserine/homoserine lactone efflux protein